MFFFFIILLLWLDRIIIGNDNNSHGGSMKEFTLNWSIEASLSEMHNCITYLNLKEWKFWKLHVPYL